MVLSSCRAVADARILPINGGGSAGRRLPSYLHELEPNNNTVSENQVDLVSEDIQLDDDFIEKYMDNW